MGLLGSAKTRLRLCAPGDRRHAGGHRGTAAGLGLDLQPAGHPVQPLPHRDQPEAVAVRWLRNRGRLEALSVVPHPQPKLPFVIGEMGVDGRDAGANIKRFKEAQAAVLKEPRFQGNVAVVKTDLFWDEDAAAVFKKGWRAHIDEWSKVGSDFPYHYLGSAKTMLAIGRAFGTAMLVLRGEKKSAN